jgi:D-arabinose 1-dehydrogenase-like Zn-dependent alcohol dehydrogenase
MKRVVIDHFGGPEVLAVVEDNDPRPGPDELRVRVLASGVSFTDALIRAGTYLGGPKPPFTPGYELVGVVEELGRGCTRLREGDRIGALTVWGANAERVCVPEKYAVEVPEDLDPAEIVSLIFPYMTAYQMLHRTARVQPGETVLIHGAAGRVGTAALELGKLAGLRMYGTCSARDRAAVEQLGAVAIDYRNEDFAARVRELTGGDGVDCDRRHRRRGVAALLPRIAGRRSNQGRPRRTTHHDGQLQHDGPRTQELARLARVVPGDSDRLALGHPVTPAPSEWVPGPEVADPAPGLVPGGPSRAAQAAP